ncbi:hypothetical protein CDQ83_15790 [Clostridium thermosuccinogenes]|nr:hypothetical protein CDQ83_15790 [Pseudoclostridium thermosuccinogenes]
MKNISNLDSELTAIINRLKNLSVSSNGSYDAPIYKHNVVKLKDEIVKTLTDFKIAIIKYLSE